jgi:hypothetical protein
MKVIYPSGKRYVSWRTPAKHALIEALDRTTRMIKKDMENISASWQHKPVIIVDLQEYRFRSYIYTDDKIVHWLDAGTRRHWVEPVKAKALAFQANYKAKTTPNSLTSYAGGASGPMRFSKGHWVSGIVPRNYAKNLAYIAARKLREEVEGFNRLYMRR